MLGMIGGIKGAIMAALGVALAIAIGIAVYKDNQVLKFVDALAASEARATTLEGAVESANEATAAWKQAAETAREQTAAVNAQHADLREAASAANEKLNSYRKKIENVAKGRPTLLARLINRAVRGVVRRRYEASGGVRGSSGHGDELSAPVPATTP